MAQSVSQAPGRPSMCSNGSQPRGSPLATADSSQDSNSERISFLCRSVSLTFGVASWNALWTCTSLVHFLTPSFSKRLSVFHMSNPSLGLGESQ